MPEDRRMTTPFAALAFAASLICLQVSLLVFFMIEGHARNHDRDASP
jgi:hypothetical protein